MKVINIENSQFDDEIVRIPNINDIPDIDNMNMKTPRIDISKDEYRVLMKDERLIEQMNNLFNNLEVVDGNVIIKEKPSFLTKILHPDTLWYSSMLFLAPALYALYFYRMFIFGLYLGVWLTSIINHHIQDLKHVMNMLDRVMVQFLSWGLVFIVLRYQLQIVISSILIAIIVISYFFSLTLTYFYPKKNFGTAPHLIMHLVTIMIGFFITDECYKINCSPINDFIFEANS